MRALDTSVVLRVILNDNPMQTVVSEELLLEPFLLTPTIILELGWVLGKTGGFGRKVASEAITAIVDLPMARVPGHDTIRWALARYAVAGDLADLIHLACSSSADSFATFDRKLARQAGGGAPVPVETLSA